MKLQHEERDEPDINLTSLIDVVFLLLIFFMVSTTFDQHALLKLDLPEATSVDSESGAEPLELVITEDGRLFLGDRQLVDDRLATLRAALAEQFDQSAGDVLVIRADGRARHRLVVRALDAAAAEGITRLSIAAVDAEGEGP